MVFTANAGLVVGRRFVRSNFRFKERRGEAQHFERWFVEHNYEVTILPDDLFFEGEGDALFAGDVLFCGYHFRSDVQAHQRLGELLSCLVISVELVDARFYHLDTCFCPLPDGGAIWYPPAFDEYARRAIDKHLGALIEVGLEEAARFACNAVVLGRDIVLPKGCPKLSRALTRRGYRCHGLSMSEFLKAGGACKCLTLFLPQREG
jgi:N-dimethylarginine dimethylaminohydrolase